MTTRSPTRDFSLMAGVLWLSFVLYETMQPVGWIQDIPFWSFWAQTMAGVDLAQNIVLFAPLGWIAHRGGWSAWRTVLTGLLISGGIEFAQQWIPGRASMATDIAFNAAGAALGWWMATPVRRPRVRLAIPFVALAVFLVVHALNTTWPAAVASVEGIDAWKGAAVTPCEPGARRSTICVVIPNSTAHGNKRVMVSGVTGQTYARVQGDPISRPLMGSDCVTTRYESTIGSWLRFRQPISLTCGLVQATDTAFELHVDPRLSYTDRGTWESRHAGAWMWPLWPFETYRRDLLRAVGALAFVIGTAMLAGTAPWWLPVGYLLMLTLAALLTGMRGPGAWVVGWTGMAWLLSMGVVRFDAWWRRPS